MQKRNNRRWTLEDLQKLPVRIVKDYTQLPNNRTIVIEDANQPKKYSTKLGNNIPIKEDDIQRECFTWFKYQYPDYCKRIFHIPNGGFRDKKTIYSKKAGKEITYSPAAQRLQRQGTLAGVWDIFLSVPKKGFSGMYIEMKAGKNTLSDLQQEFMEANKDDYLFKVCYSLDDFELEINNY